MVGDTPGDELTDKEIAERMDRALRRSFTMPHKPTKEIVGKRARPPEKKRQRKPVRGA